MKTLSRSLAIVFLGSVLLLALFSRGQNKSTSFLPLSFSPLPSPTLPADSYHRALLIYDLISKDRAREALLVVDELVQKEENYRDAWYLKALSHSLLGEFGRALEALNRALKIDPQFEAGLKLGRQLQALRN